MLPSCLPSLVDIDFLMSLLCFQSFKEQQHRALWGALLHCKWFNCSHCCNYHLWDTELFVVLCRWSCKYFTLTFDLRGGLWLIIQKLWLRWSVFTVMYQLAVFSFPITDTTTCAHMKEIMEITIRFKFHESIIHLIKMPQSIILNRSV